jgi:hypothetical protein
VPLIVDGITERNWPVSLPIPTGFHCKKEID